ncbi:MAG: hypothetical protein ACRDNK_05730 [Solirubrobacteraceae bacterium]
MTDTAVMETAPSGRALNVVLSPESEAHRQVRRQHTPARPQAAGAKPSRHLAPGFQPQPSWNLTNFGGPTISSLTFVNRYVGGTAAWSTSDMTNIDNALSAALSDSGLESVMAQYFPGATISSTMLPSAVHDGGAPGTVFKDTAEALAQQLHSQGALGPADPAKTVICMMLPQGVVLSDNFSPGFTPPAGASAAEGFKRRKRGVIKVEAGDAADSKNGLGGYHGSVHLADGTEIFYAVGVYSEGGNGIDAFGVPWKNVVATFYHELCEARTDAAVEDVNSTGNNGLLGWYSQTGQGEVGDLPINACNGDLSLVFKEVQLASGSASVPIQLMWSNADAGPAASTG